MHDMQRRMEDLKNQYAQDKETYRIQLVSSLLQAKKTQVDTEVKNLRPSNYLSHKCYASLY